MAADPRLTNAVGTRLRYTMATELGRAVARGVKGVNDGILAAAQAFADQTADPVAMQRIHSDVASVAQAAVLARYDETVEAEKKVPSYRIGDRFSGGVLRSALAQRSMVVGTVEGIDYIDQDVLNQEAKHWQRLNFGAGEAGRANRPGSFRFIFDGRVLGHFEFRAGPRPEFYLPWGFWKEPGGGEVAGASSRRGHDEFYVRREKNRPQFMPNPTRGIEAREFLDAGLEVMAQELPGRYQQQLELWWAAGVRAGQLYMSGLRGKPRAGGSLPIRR